MTDSKTEITQETQNGVTDTVSQESGEKPLIQDGAPKPNETSISDLDSWKAASRKWEDRAKANKANLDKLTAERDRDMEKITSLEAELSSLKDTQSNLLREAVAAVKGVPAHRITGATREELEADADTFLQELNSVPQRGVVPTSGQGGEQPISSVVSGRERAREALGKS